MKDRLGRFYICNELIHVFPEGIKLIMSKVIVVRCEHLGYKNQFEYYALSDEFDEVQEGCEIPLYDVVVDKDGVKFTKK